MGRAVAFEIVRIRPDNPDFIYLVKVLNTTLAGLTGDTGESSYSAEIFDASTDCALVGYQDGKPVACGTFRYHSDWACEIKRMYSSVRGTGYALLKSLEENAQEMGYREVVLSTRKVNQQAVSFYLRQGYKEIPSYGKYIGRDNSVCMGKLL